MLIYNDSATREVQFGCACAESYRPTRVNMTCDLCDICSLIDTLHISSFFTVHGGMQQTYISVPSCGEGGPRKDHDHRVSSGRVYYCTPIYLFIICPSLLFLLGPTRTSHKL